MLKLKIHNLLTNKNHYRKVVVFVVLILLCFRIVYVVKSQIPPVPATDIPVSHINATTTSTVLNASEPVHLTISSIGLSASFVAPLGLAASGEVSVPDNYTDVGWYKFSPTPGERGPAVILGHVDSYQGPAVFWSLGQVKIGDEILVERADGTIATFLVEGFERYPQSDFPTEKVYGNIPYAGLRLITCSGTYNKGAKRYTHNLVVYARLKDS